jgi:hypothetical protein
MRTGSRTGSRFSREETSEERRRTVASYASYEQAERAVDYLADHGFPVERAAIVGRDLKFVEHVTGRVGYPEAALRGMLSGALAGLLIGWLFAIFDWVDPAIARGWVVFDGLWFGAVAGTLAGVLAHALTRGRRNFGGISAMTAERYEVIVDEEAAADAERMLAQMDGQAHATSR